MRRAAQSSAEQLRAERSDSCIFCPELTSNGVIVQYVKWCRNQEGYSLFGSRENQ